MVLFYLISISLLIVYLLFEFHNTKKITSSIPLKILVNGTRGKSTLVHMLYDILRLNGKNVFGKSTGDKPLLLFPDKNKKTIRRFSPTSIIENIKILKQISREETDAIVFECMALQSEPQYFLSKILSPTHIIITNILPDHQEVMGNSKYDNFKTMSQCIHHDSLVYLPDKLNQDLYKFSLHNHNFYPLSDLTSQLVCENIPRETINASWTLIDGFCSELKFNSNITKKVFESYWKKIDKDIKHTINNNGVSIFNFFSINDVKTTDAFLKYNLNENLNNSVFILNCRLDRPLRIKSFIDYINNSYANTEILFCGNGKKLAYHYLGNKKISRFVKCEDLFQIISDKNNVNKNFFCLGNYKGMEKFIADIKNSTLHHGEIK